MRLHLERITRLTPTTIALLYALLGMLWFFSSDWLLGAFVTDPYAQTPFRVYKNWGFVAVTAIVLYLAIRSSQHAIKDAKATLALSEERSRLALDGADEGFWEWRPESDALHFSARNLTLLGYAADEFAVTIESWTALVHPDDQAALEQMISHLRSGQIETFRHEYRARAKDGEYRWLLCRGKVVERGADGRPARVVGTHVDITARHRIEDELRESEERFGALLSASPDMIFMIDREQRILYVNSAAARAFGFAPERMIGRKQGEFFDPQTALRHGSVIRRIFENGAPVRTETETLMGGRKYWIETHLVAVKGPGGEIVSTLGFARDITERRQAEATLRDAYKNISEILESISDGFFVLDERMVIRVFNKAAEQMLGCGATEAVGRPFFELFPAFAGTIFEDTFREAMIADRNMLFETELPRAPFENWYDVRVIPIQGGVSVFFRITTEQKRFQARMAQMQRMEAVARLAGGIAHDFNNQLAAILGYNELLAHDLSPDHAGRTRIEQIRKATERSAMLTRQLLAFGRKQVLEPAILDLNLVVADLSEILRRMVGENIEMRLELAADLRRVRIDRAQIEQALINLAANARDAMSDGGRLTIETRNVVLDEDYGRKHLDVTPGPYVLLAVADTGCGMDEATLQHIFEPFFSTKPDGRGTGLGLSSIYGFVSQSAGHLAADSAPGRGSRFAIYLPPAADAEEPGLILTAAAAPALRESSQVLVVEDEEIVRRLITEVLIEAGYKVLSATQGAEAIDLVRTRGSAVDLLVSDAIMPGISGRQLAERLRAVYPAMRVLYVSGYPQEEINAAIEPGAPFLQKPFVPTQLIQKIDLLLRKGR